MERTAEPVFVRKNSILESWTSYVASMVPSRASPESSSHTPASSTSLKSKPPYHCARFVQEDFTFNESIERVQSTFCMLLLGSDESFSVWDITDAAKIIEKVSNTELHGRKVMDLQLIWTKEEASYCPDSPVIVLLTENITLNESLAENRISILHLFSLKDDQLLEEKITFSKLFRKMECNENLIIVGGGNDIEVYNSGSLAQMAFFNDVISPIDDQAVFDLNHNWICYPCKRISSNNFGEEPKDFSDIYMDSAIDIQREVGKVAGKVVEGLKIVGSYGKQAISQYVGASSMPIVSHSIPNFLEATPTGVTNKSSSFDDKMQSIPETPDGYIIIKDIGNKEQNGALPPVLAHFRSHRHKISIIKFNSSSNMLATACVYGSHVHVFGVDFNIETREANISLLYKLKRGFSFATVTDISFSKDSRWMSLTSHHGTTHMFPINPHGGGKPNAFSHSSLLIQNPARKFSGQEPFQTYSLNPILRFRIGKNLEEKSNPNGIGGSSSPEPKLSEKESLIPLVISVVFPTESQRSEKAFREDPTFSAVNIRVPIFMFHFSGMLRLCRMYITREFKRKKKSGRIVTVAELKVSPQEIADWNLIQGDLSHSKTLHRLPLRSVDSNSSWLSNMEIRCYQAPTRGIWTGPQCHFQRFIGDGLDAEDIKIIPEEPEPYKDRKGGPGYVVGKAVEKKVLTSNIHTAMESNIEVDFSKLESTFRDFEISFDEAYYIEKEERNEMTEEELFDDEGTTESITDRISETFSETASSGLSQEDSELVFKVDMEEYKKCLEEELE